MATIGLDRLYYAKITENDAVLSIALGKLAGALTYFLCGMSAE